ncbi:MAG: hypothetical protein J5824_10710 [Lachnospiraceae bacterium]|nr:hypothetical protein [Lachnospiraceae bacterium]
MDFTGIKPYSSDTVSVPDTYYSLGEDCIVIHKYIPSHLESGYIKLSQDRLPTGEIVFLFENYFDGTLALLSDSEDKLPDITVKIDHDEFEPAINHGYILVGGPFDAGCKVILSQPPLKDDSACETPSETENVVATGLFETDSEVENNIGEDSLAEDTGENTAIEVAADTVADENNTIDDAADTIVNEDTAAETVADTVTGEAAAIEAEADTVADEDTAIEVEADTVDGEDNAIEAEADTAVEATTDTVTGEDPAIKAAVTDTPVNNIPDENSVPENDSYGVENTTDLDSPADDEMIPVDVSDDNTDSADTVDDIEDDIDTVDASEDDISTNNDADTAVNASSGISALPAYSHTYENASILYSEEKQRYVLKIAEGAGAHAILPGGVEVFARSDGHAFKGYRMRIGEKEYDLVVMNVSELSEKAHRCNAYMKTLGSFSGDCCYCIDIAHPEKNGTHGVRKGTAYIDCETGYKWGMTTPGCYEFELENGNYNVYTITKTSDGSTFSDKASRKVSNGYLTLYSEGETFTHISITAADAVISESSTYEWLTPDEKVLEAAYLYIPDEISDETVNGTANAVSNEVPFSPLIDTLVANDTQVASKPDRTLKEPQFEHIDTGRSSENSDKHVVSPYVFDVLEPTDKNSTDKKSIKEDETLTADDHGIAEIRATHTSEHTEGEVAAILLTHTDAAEAAINESTDENSKSARSAEQLGEKNTISNNIRVSTYSVTVPAAKKKNAEHQNTTLKAKKAKNAATAAGIAAGAALLGGIIKALTGKKK